MKNSIFAWLLVCGATQAISNGPADGYLITATNDTIRCKIHVSGLQLFDEVHIVDSFGREIAYYADQESIHGFGFFYKKHRYDYVPKEDETGRRQFLIRISTGDRLSLYYHFDMVENYNGFFRDETYLLEDVQGHLLTIGENPLGNFKKKVREFLNADNALRLLFDKTVFTFSDIPKFVRSANKQMN